MNTLESNLLLQQMFAATGNPIEFQFSSFPDLSRPMPELCSFEMVQTQRPRGVKRLENILAARDQDSSLSTSGDLDDIISGFRGTASSSSFSSLSQSQLMNSAACHLASEDSSQFDLLLQLVQHQAKLSPLDGFPAGAPVSKKLRADVSNACSAQKWRPTSTHMAPQSHQVSGAPLAAQAGPTQVSELSGCLAQPSQSSDQSLNVEEKRLKRKESNREAARRMRKRHADRVGELQAEVANMRQVHCEALRELKEAQERILALEERNRQLASRNQRCQVGPPTTAPEPCNEVPLGGGREAAAVGKGESGKGVKREREVDACFSAKDEQQHLDPVCGERDDLLYDASLDELFSTTLFDLPGL